MLKYIKNNLEGQNGSDWISICTSNILSILNEFIFIRRLFSALSYVQKYIFLENLSKPSMKLICKDIYLKMLPYLYQLNWFWHPSELEEKKTWYIISGYAISFVETWEIIDSKRPSQSARHYLAVVIRVSLHCTVVKLLSVQL